MNVCCFGNSFTILSEWVKKEETMKNQKKQKKKYMKGWMSFKFDGLRSAFQTSQHYSFPLFKRDRQF